MSDESTLAKAYDELMASGKPVGPIGIGTIMSVANREFEAHYKKIMGDKPAAKSITRKYPDYTEHIKMIPKKVTIYKIGDIGGAPKGIEAVAYNYAIAPYAQYSKALHVYYIPKGKRNIRGFVDASYEPSTIILDGWNHLPSAGETFTPWSSGRTPGVITNQTRYLAHDPRYKSEAKAIMNDYLKSSHAKIIVDFRK